MLSLCAAVGASVVAFHPAMAAVDTWDGGGADALTSNPLNWSGDVAPAATGDTLIFAGSSNLVVNNDSITSLATSGTAITFDTTAGSFNLGGNQLTLGSGAGAGQVIIQQNSTNAQTISANLKLSGGNGDRSIVFGAGAGSLTLSGNIDFGAGNGDWLFPTTAAGTIILSGTNTGDGKATVALTSGTNTMRAMLRNNILGTVLTLGSDGALGNSGSGDIALGTASLRGIYAGANMTLNTANGDRNLSGSSLVINTAKVTYDGASKLTLGNVVVQGGNRDLWTTGAGQLTVGNAIALSEGTTGRNLFLSVGNGGMVVDGKIYDTFSNTGGAFATLANAGILRKSGTGTLTLNGDSNFVAIVQVEGGTLKMGHANALGSTSTAAVGTTTTAGFTLIKAGTLDLNGFSTAEKILNDNNAAVLMNSSTTASVLSTDMSVNANLAINATGDITVPRLIGNNVRLITKLGAGTLTTNGSSHNNLIGWDIQAGKVVLANATGGLGADRGVTLNGGTLQLSGSNPQLINDSQAFTINSGTFDLNGKGEAVASIGGAGGTITNTSANTATVYVGGGPGGTSTASYGGVIEDGLGVLKVTKEGTGTQTLTGNHTYTGATTVSKGTLAINGSIVSPVTVKSTGFIAGNGSINNDVVVEAGGGVSPGAVAIGNLNIGGNLDLSASTASYEWQFDNAGSVGTGGVNFDLIGQTGAGSTLTLGGTVNVALTSGDYTNAFWDTNQSFKIVDVANAFGTSGSLSVNATGSTGQGVFTTTVSSGDVFLNWTAIAGTGSWIGASGGSFGTAANWAANSVPLSNYNVEFGAAGGGGTVNLDAVRTIANPATIYLSNGAAGAYNLAAGSGGSFNFTGEVGVAVASAAETHTISAPITGVGSLTKSGDGSLVLAGSNTYAGGTKLLAGTVILGNSASLGSGSLQTSAGSTLDLAGFSPTVGSLSGAGSITSASVATLTLGQSDTTTYSGVIGGAVALNKTGAGTVTLGGANTYAGGTTLTGGAVLVPNNSFSPFGTGTLTLAATSSTNPVLIVQPNSGGPTSSSVHLTNNIVVNPGTTNIVDNSVNAFGNLWLSGNITGTGTLVFRDTNPSASQFTATSAVLFLGDKLGGFNGTIQLESSNPIGRSYGYLAMQDLGDVVTSFDASQTAWVLGSSPTGGSGIIKWNNTQPGPVLAKLGSVAGVSPNSRLESSNVAATTFEIGALNTSTSFAGVVVNAGTGLAAITKVGTGVLTLTGANTYTGLTQVAGGSLVLNIAGGAAQPVLGGASVTTPGGADVKSGKLIFDYTGTTSPASQVASILNNAAYLANFSAGQIFTSGAVDSTHTLGWYDDVAAKRLTIVLTRAGDSNVDGIVNFDDLLALAQNYNAAGTATWQKGDFNYDTNVNFDDLLVLAQNYNQSASVDITATLGSGFAADWALAQSLVPEPTSLAALGAMSTMLIRRRRA